MKKTLLAALLVTVAGIVSAGAQTQSQTFTAPTKHKPVQKQPPELKHPRAIGAFARVAANPLQALNPRASANYYGPPQETVITDNTNYEANRHQQVTGLILFGLAW